MEAKGLGKRPKVVEEGMPKRGLSSFFLYSADARERIKKSNPDVKQQDILKKIGQEWKGISDAERKKWEERSRADKERYERQLAEYKQNGASAATAATEAGKKRPANKGTTSASKKAKKETQS